MKAKNLKVEYLTNPVGIDYVSPRLSWQCDGGIQQSAYRIIAVDDEDNCAWDSGKVLSDQMHLVKWNGRILKSRDVITWYVILWDENDIAEDLKERSTFEIGLLQPEDWKAKWITGNYKVHKKERYPVDCFRKHIDIPEDKKIKKARAYMSACGVYEGNINGHKIGQFYLAPGITDYRKRVQYQTADITPLLKSGENQIDFMLADGWYRGSVGAWGLKNAYGTETKLLVQIEIVYEDGTKDIICSDDTFEWTNEGPIRFADNKDGEIYDARLENLSGAQWKKAKETSHSVIPSASNNFDLTEHEHFSHPRLIVTPSGKQVLDFGQNIAGTVSFHIRAKSGDKLHLRFGEKLDINGEFTQHNIQCVNKKITTPFQEIKFTCKEGMNDYKMRFAIFGYQYIQIEASDMSIRPEDFTAIAVYSDFETTAVFECSNPLLNQFVQNTLWSLKNNSADLPTDCPTRERHGWSGDAQIFVNTATYLVNYAPFALKYENDLCDWQKKNGKFPQIAPEGGTDFYMKPMDGSVGWADAGVMIPYRLWKKYDDIDIVRRYYPQMKAYAQFCMQRCNKWMPLVSESTGIKGKDKKYLYNFGQHYGEWAEPADVHKMSFKDFMSANPEVATAYCSYLMLMMTEIAKCLDDEDLAKRYQTYADGCKHTYQQMRANVKNTLDTDRQAKLVRPLYMHLLDDTQESYARQRLIQALDHYGWRVGTGFLSTPFILYVLADIDISYAYKLLENEEKPGWLFMVKSGATTIWEDWDGPTSDNGKGGGVASLNHYSKGAVCEWIFEVMCGIKVDGRNHFVIAPRPGGTLTYAKASYDSVFGTVSCEWQRQTGNTQQNHPEKICENGKDEVKTDARYEYQIIIPANTTATVKLPGKPAQLLEAGAYQF